MRCTEDNPCPATNPEHLRAIKTMPQLLGEEVMVIKEM